MQKQMSIYIPKPCHEDWNKMTPTQQGKFCASCHKQVIDFSLMSDRQILNFLSHQSGKLCGRFDAEQLQRPLIETKIKKKKSWWMALTMPLLFLFDRSDAQKTILKNSPHSAQSVNKNYALVGDVEPIIVKDTISSSIDSELKEQITGKVAFSESLKQITIGGKVVDGNNNPVPFASIIQKGTNHEANADSLGNFSIKINSYEDSVTLVSSCIGYETKEKIIGASENNVMITMQLQAATLGDVVVVGEAFTRRRGAVSICTTITTFQKMDSSFRKAIGISNVYPNPVLRGNSIHIKIKNPGDYQVQLFDNTSRPMQAEEINTVSNNSTNQIQLPSNIAAGVYYLRLINEQTKKSYTEKLIIQ